MPTQTQKKVITLTVEEFCSTVFVDPSRNIREFYNVNEMAEQIFDAGEVWEALEIYKATKDDQTDLQYVLGPDGNRRAHALKQLFEQDRYADVAPVPCLLLPHKPDAMGYLVRQLQSGNLEGKLALNAIEEGKGYKQMRALDSSLTNAILAKRVGRSEQYVKGRQQLADAPSALHDLCPYIGDKLTETLARTYNKDSGDLSQKNLLYVCEQVQGHITPGAEKPVSDDALEFCREITGVRGKNKKEAAVEMVAKAAPKKAKIIGVAGGPNNQRQKTADDLSKTAKTVLAACWNVYTAALVELPEDSPIRKALEGAKVKTLIQKEGVIRGLVEKTPESKILTAFAGMAAILQSHGIEEKHPVKVARAIADAIAKDTDKDE